MNLCTAVAAPGYRIIIARDENLFSEWVLDLKKNALRNGGMTNQHDPYLLKVLLI
jgi:hypothetical protein